MTKHFARDIYLVVGGESKTHSGNLTKNGKEAAKQARDTLLKQNLGNKSLVLSSVTRSDVRTGEILSKGLGGRHEKRAEVFDLCQEGRYEEFDARKVRERIIKIMGTDGFPHAAIAVVVTPDFVQQAPDAIQVESGQVYELNIQGNLEQLAPNNA